MKVKNSSRASKVAAHNLFTTAATRTTTTELIQLINIRNKNNKYDNDSQIK